jgi:hypothetical protein
MKTFSKKHILYLVLVASLAVFMTFSCKDNPEGNNGNNASGPPMIDHVGTPDNQDMALKKAHGGQQVVIVGKNLKNPQSITFNGTPASIDNAITSKKTIQVKVPDNANFMGDSQYLVVSNSKGSDSTALLIIQPKPTIKKFTPLAGAGGDTLTINGKYFEQVDTVMVGDQGAQIFSSTSTMIKAILPPSPNGLITVTTPGGTVKSVVEIKTAIPKPAITGFLPSIGASGQTVTIDGHNLKGATDASIGGAQANITSTDSNKVKITVPGDDLFGKVSLTTSGGTAISDIPFGYKKAVYLDDVNSSVSWYKGGYGSSEDYKNSEHAIGSKSIKVDLTSKYGAVQLLVTAGTFDISDMSTIEFTIYAPSDSDIGSLKVSINKDFDDGVDIDVKPGGWTVVTASLSDMGSPTSLTELDVQGTGNTGIYWMDNIVFY